MESNVVELDFSQRGTKTSILGQTGAALVHELLITPKISWTEKLVASLEGDQKGHKEFFENLFRLKQVCIVSNESDINLNSAMTVSDPMSGDSWQLWIATFVKYLQLGDDFDIDNDLSSHIIYLLDNAGIEIGLSVDDSSSDSPQEFESIHDVMGFFPEKIFSEIRIDGKQIDEYEVVTNIEDPKNGFYTDANMFRDAHTFPVLFLMLDVVQQATRNGQSPSPDMSVEVSKYEKKRIHTITMTFSELCEQVDQAILRKFPLYAHYRDPLMRRSMLYNTHIAGRRLPTEETGDDDGE